MKAIRLAVGGSMDKSNEGRAAMDVKFHFSSKTRHTMVNSSFLGYQFFSQCTLPMSNSSPHLVLCQHGGIEIGEILVTDYISSSEVWLESVERWMHGADDVLLGCGAHPYCPLAEEWPAGPGWRERALPCLLDSQCQRLRR
jgi:hypothetical protein